jgi:hypothetical protein
VSLKDSFFAVDGFESYILLSTPKETHTSRSQFSFVCLFQTSSWSQEMAQHSLDRIASHRIRLHCAHVKNERAVFPVAEAPPENDDALSTRAVDGMNAAAADASTFSDTTSDTSDNNETVNPIYQQLPFNNEVLKSNFQDFYLLLELGHVIWLSATLLACSVPINSTTGDNNDFPVSRDEDAYFSSIRPVIRPLLKPKVHWDLMMEGHDDQDHVSARFSLCHFVRPILPMKSRLTLLCTMHSKSIFMTGMSDRRNCFVRVSPYVS